MRKRAKKRDLFSELVSGFNELRESRTRKVALKKFNAALAKDQALCDAKWLAKAESARKEGFASEEDATALLVNLIQDGAIECSREDAEMLINMLESPPIRNEAFAKAVERYKRKITK